MGDVIAVRDGIKVARQSQTLQNKGRVLTGRANGQLVALCAERIQSGLHLIAQVSGSDAAEAKAGHYNMDKFSQLLEVV